MIVNNNFEKSNFANLRVQCTEIVTKNYMHTVGKGKVEEAYKECACVSMCVCVCGRGGKCIWQLHGKHGK